MDNPDIASSTLTIEEPLGAPAPPDLADLDLNAVWSERLRDAKRQSIEHPDPFIACLGTHNSDLLGTANRLERTINTILDGKRLTPKLFERVRPMIDTMLKLTRQTDRLTRITRQDQRGEASPL